MKTARIVGMAVILMMVAGAAALPPETSGTSSAKDGKTPDPAPAVEKDRGMEMYAVIPDSMAVWGCWNPCKCPIQFVGELWGEFYLLETSSSRVMTTYDVIDFYCVVTDDAGQMLYDVVGSGMYTVNTPAEGEPTVQWVLDLTWDGRTDQFDSGVIPLAPGAECDFIVANNDFVCLNDAFYIHAVPVLPGAVTGLEAPGRTQEPSSTLVEGETESPEAVTSENE